MEINVTGCKDCPFYHNGINYEYAHYCKHPNSIQKISCFASVVAEPKIGLYGVQEKFKDKDGYDYTATYPITPEWCPLNTEPITITKNK